MAKKNINLLILLLIIPIILSLSTVTVFANDKAIKAGDQIQLIFTIGKVNNVCGVSAMAEYNSEYLNVINAVCTVGGSEVNVSNPGEIRWNFIVYNGTAFDNDDVTVITFETINDCSIDMLGFNYNCMEFFDPDGHSISDTSNSFLTARMVHKGTEYQINIVDSPNSDIINSDNETFNTDILSSNPDDNSDRNTSSIDLTDTDTNYVTNSNAVINERLSDNTSTNIKSNTEKSDIDTTRTVVQESSVNTSGSQILTVILLLLILFFSGIEAIILYKLNIKRLHHKKL